MTSTPTESGGDSTWAKLRRRKVVQWGIVYVAFAWGLLQGIGFVADAFAWPAAAKQIATLVLLIGLPIVLVLSWYHGDRGQQRVTATELTILTLLFLLGGGFLWNYQRGSGSTTPPAPPVDKLTPATASDARPSIAVLPFENRSKLDDDAYFVDGIHDDILTQLSKVSALKVISRTSVEQFRDTKMPTREIAEKLGVRSILEGGVQRAGDRVHINVQLIDANSDAHLWAESYDRELTAANIFAIQSEVAAAIAAALRTALTPTEQAHAQVVPTESLEAWEAYQLGMRRIVNRTTAGLRDGEQFFRKAIELDAKFALAWVGLANTLTWQVVHSDRSKDAAFRDAEQAVARALELDQNLAEAWASAGYVAYTRLAASPEPTQLEWRDAEQKLRRAISLNPNYALAYLWLSLTLSNLDLDEALAMAERAVALDPLSAISNSNLGDLRVSVGLFDDALVAYGRAIEIDQALAVAYWKIGDELACHFGRLDTAVPWYEKAASLDPDSPWPSLVRVYSDLGANDEAERLLGPMLARGEGSAGTNAVAAPLYLERGDEESARRYAQRAAELDPGSLYLIRNDDLRRGEYTAARARYMQAFPALFAKELPTFNYYGDAFAAIDLALVLQHTDEGERAKALLDRSEAYLSRFARMGAYGYGLSNVAIQALRGNTAEALAKLREAEQDGWRCEWRYYRDFDPNLASIRNEPGFKAVFADIERDMAEQRARVAARPKDAPLKLMPVRRVTP